MKKLIFNFDGGNEKDIAVWAYVSTDGYSDAGYCDASLPQTNNIAEWSALMAAMERALTLVDEYDAFEFKGDSELVIKQIRTEYACKKPHLIPFFDRCRQIHNEITIDRNTDCQYNHVRREFNKEADELGRMFRDGKYKPRPILYPEQKADIEAWLPSDEQTKEFWKAVGTEGLTDGNE